MTKIKKIISALTAVTMLCTGIGTSGMTTSLTAKATDSLESSMDWGTVEIGGGGYVSGIVTGQQEMYLRTDVGGAYKYDYDSGEWVQLLDFLTEADRGLLSVSGIAIDPTDDDTFYMLCGCAYFSGAKTVIFKTTDGGETFTEHDVTDMIQCHANGDGRECSEPIAVDPDNPDIIYAGGDVASGSSCLIKSTDGGETWNSVDGYDSLGMYINTINWPKWETHTVRATMSGEYNTQNGVDTIHIEGGKVYVGTAITGEANVHVADVDTDEFSVLSEDLPTANYPVTISSDNNGNLFVTYIAGLAFSGSAGGAYKYNIASGAVTDISPSGSAFGMITADKDDPDKLLARSCGLWSDQWYEEEWTETSIAWGDYFYRSTDGGKTWTNITPGKKAGDWGNEYFVSLPIDTNGYDWIYGKAIHWGSGILIDPRNPNKILMTSGNGVFACDNVWDESGVQFYFDPKGIEEVVALDMCSVPGGSAYSAIGDYDGFIHTDSDVVGTQYSPNMGSTCAIAYCPQNPDVMIRIAENQNDTAPGFYTLDGGKTWTKMANTTGGKAAITQLEDGSYRFFKSGSSDGNVSYSDDYGQTWTAVSGISSAYGSKTTYMLVEPNQPNVVYAYATYYNSSWSYSKPAAEFSDAHYTLYVSTDYGKTFTGTDIAMYDQCDSAGRIAYLGEDDLILGAGWYGMFRVTDGGKTVTPLDVYYCKTVGYGAAEKDGDPYTLYMYGQPKQSDPEGIYRSTDCGETWVLINQNHLYGGTGNGNFLVGDMNTFGTVYMSTVGCGIVVGKLTGSDDPKPVTTTAPVQTTTTEKAVVTSTTTKAVTTIGSAVVSESQTVISSADVTTTGNIDTVTPSEDILYGDVNLDGRVDITDAVQLNKAIAGSVTLSAEAKANSDCNANNSTDTEDAVILLQFLVHTITALPYNSAT